MRRTAHPRDLCPPTPGTPGLSRRGGLGRARARRTRGRGCYRLFGSPVLNPESTGPNSLFRPNKSLVKTKLGDANRPSPHPRSLSHWGPGDYKSGVGTGTSSIKTSLPRVSPSPASSFMSLLFRRVAHVCKLSQPGQSSFRPAWGIEEGLWICDPQCPHLRSGGSAGANTQRDGEGGSVQRFAVVLGSYCFLPSHHPHPPSPDLGAGSASGGRWLENY